MRENRLEIASRAGVNKNWSIIFYCLFTEERHCGSVTEEKARVMVCRGATDEHDSVAKNGRHCARVKCEVFAV